MSKEKYIMAPFAKYTVIYGQIYTENSSGVCLHMS